MVFKVILLKRVGKDTEFKTHNLMTHGTIHSVLYTNRHINTSAEKKELISVASGRNFKLNNIVTVNNF